MTEAELNMAEVRIRMPEKQALSWFSQICDGDIKLSDIGIDDDAEISMVPVSGIEEEPAEPSAQPADDIDKKPADSSIFTEVFETEGGEIELVTATTFHNFAEHAIETDKRLNPQSQRHLATRAYHTLVQGLGKLEEDYVHYGPLPGMSALYLFPLGLKADMGEEIAQKLKGGSIEQKGLGENSRAFIHRFFAAFLESRNAQAEAVQTNRVELGSTALSTQRHELQLRLGQA